MDWQPQTIYLKLFYDGAEYFGWSKQPGLPTVQLALERSLLRIGCRIHTISCASRTDAGVSAFGQLVKLVCKETVSLEALNSVLPDNIAVTHYSKRVGKISGKKYVYVYPSKWNNPKLIRFAAAQISAPPLCERFFKKGGAPPATLCKINFRSLGDCELVFFDSKGFGYQQIRRIMGVFDMLDAEKFCVDELKTLDPGKIKTANSDGLILLQVKAHADWVQLIDGVQKAENYMQKLIAKAVRIHSKWAASLLLFEQQR